LNVLFFFLLEVLFGLTDQLILKLFEGFVSQSSVSSINILEFYSEVSHYAGHVLLQSLVVMVGVLSILLDEVVFLVQMLQSEVGLIFE